MQIAVHTSICRCRFKAQHPTTTNKILSLTEAQSYRAVATHGAGTVVLQAGVKMLHVPLWRGTGNGGGRFDRGAADAVAGENMSADRAWVCYKRV